MAERRRNCLHENSGSFPLIRVRLSVFTVSALSSSSNGEFTFHPISSLALWMTFKLAKTHQPKIFSSHSLTTKSFPSPHSRSLGGWSEGQTQTNRSTRQRLRAIQTIKNVFHSSFVGNIHTYADLRSYLRQHEWRRRNDGGRGLRLRRQRDQGQRPSGVATGLTKSTETSAVPAGRSEPSTPSAGAPETAGGWPRPHDRSRF